MNLSYFLLYWSNFLLQGKANTVNLTIDSEIQQQIHLTISCLQATNEIVSFFQHEEIVMKN